MECIRKDLIEKKYGEASNLAFNEKIKQMIKQGKKIYHFGFGQSPFPVIEAATEALRENAAANEYLHVQGLPELRKGICDFHQHYDQLTIDPDNIIVGPGSKELLLILMTVFGGDIIVNSPAWTTYRPQALLAGRSPLLVDSQEEEDWRVTPAGLEKALSGVSKDNYKLLILCNPCNPSGVCYTEDQLNELVKTCRKHKVLILCDEIYARVHYTNEHVSIAKVYPEGGILSSGMSKWAAAGGWRMGYNVYPKELRPLLSIVASAGTHSYSCAPAPMQYAFAKVLSDLPTCTEYISHVNRIMCGLANFSARHLTSVGVTVKEPRGGFYMFPNFEVIRPALKKRGVKTGQEMCDLMLKEINVALMPGGPAHLRPVDELTTRLCFVNFDGAIPLAESRKLGLNKSLDDAFLKEFCAPVCDGIMALVQWVAQLKAEQTL